MLADFPSKKVGKAISSVKILIWPLLSLHVKDRHCAMLEFCHRHDSTYPNSICHGIGSIGVT